MLCKTDSKKQPATNLNSSELFHNIEQDLFEIIKKMVRNKTKYYTTISIDFDKEKGKLIFYLDAEELEFEVEY